jgi:hypothetical protein
MAGIDKIVIKDGSATKTLTPVEWKALPLTQRVKYLGSNPEFFAGGQKVNPKDAVAQLR